MESSNFAGWFLHFRISNLTTRVFLPLLYPAPGSPHPPPTFPPGSFSPYLPPTAPLPLIRHKCASRVTLSICANKTHRILFKITGKDCKEDEEPS